MDAAAAEAIENEIEVVSTMYEDAVVREDSHPYRLTLFLPFAFVLQVDFPLQGYPDEKYPSFNVVSGPNSVLQGEFSQALGQAIRENIELGQADMLLLALPMAINMAESFEGKVSAERAAKAQEAARVQEDMEQAAETQQMEEKKSPFFQSAPISDRKSKFIAHLAPVASVADVRRAVRFLRAQKDIAAACHPAIWAYRFRDGVTGQLCADRDDDGETGASSRIMFLLEQLQVEGWLVVVTRWFGGVLLGPDRFKHIMRVTREVLTRCPDVKPVAAP